MSKLGPVYSPDGLVLKFEVTGDRKNFIDLQKIYLEIKCQIVQSSGADLKYDGAATVDNAKTDVSYICTFAMSCIHFSMTAQC